MKFHGFLWAMVWITALMGVARADIQIEGVTDRQIYAGPVVFRLLPQPGSHDLSLLDGTEIPGDMRINVDQAGWHAIEVNRQYDDGRRGEQIRMQFVIQDPVRMGAESGLSPWTPRPSVPSSSDEAQQAHLRVIAPVGFPAHREIPVIALTEYDNRDSCRLNGTVSLEGDIPGFVKIKRGMGSAFLPSMAQAVALSWDARLHHLVTHRTIQIEENVPWTRVGGWLSEDVTWLAGSRIWITNDVTIASGATLTVCSNTLVMADVGTTLFVEGRIRIEGTTDHPVVIMASDPLAGWGGMVLWQAPAEAVLSGGIFTGSGSTKDWFAAHNIAGTHRPEQAFLYLGPGAKATLSDCFLIDNQGQAFHGETATLSMDHCLVQRCQTVGEFNDGSVTIRHSGLIDFPSDDSQYMDGDNDALYFTLGTHRLENTLIGWCKDDGIDAGGNTAGNVDLIHCWIESCFHEGLALSGAYKIVNVSDSVILGCGQGVEAGYAAPIVKADHCLLLENEVGARFGDNYDWGYSGRLTVTNSLVLYNDRDVWGFEFNDWIEKVSNMTILGNLVTQIHPDFLENTPWNLSEAKRLDDFRSTSAGKVGAGFLTTNTLGSGSESLIWLEVGTSSFSTKEVTVACQVVGGNAAPGVDYVGGNGLLVFSPGQMVQAFPVRILDALTRKQDKDIVLQLTSANGSEVFADSSLHHLVIPAQSGNPDTDQDGLPDLWERTIIEAKSTDSITNYVQVNAGDDFDGDGLANGEEYAAGTSPADPGSCFRLIARKIHSGMGEVNFLAVGGRGYVLEKRENCGALSSWTAVQTLPVAPTNRICRIPVQFNGEEVGFFRARLASP